MLTGLICLRIEASIGSCSNELLLGYLSDYRFLGNYALWIAITFVS
jgi:hypothetical protein